MQQRRLRLGDILDDYCPRERRVTNHAIVAMIDDEIKQTRCTTCDADHEYKQAKVPAPRRKKDPGALFHEVLEDPSRPRPIHAAEARPADAHDETPEPDDAREPIASSETLDAGALPESVTADPEAPAEQDEGPVHRPLIRATLPRPEGQVPERRPPEFTIRQPGARGGREFDGPKSGQRHGRGRRSMRAQGGASGQPTRFGPARPGSGHGSGQGQRPGGNRPGPGGQRGDGRPGGPQGRGPRHGSGGGRKRGR